MKTNADVATVTTTALFTVMAWLGIGFVLFIVLCGTYNGIQKLERDHKAVQELQKYNSQYLKPGWHENPDGSASPNR